MFVYQEKGSGKVEAPSAREAGCLPCRVTSPPFTLKSFINISLHIFIWSINLRYDDPGVQKKIETRIY